jgi:mRNA interferase RelE/StbE
MANSPPDEYTVRITRRAQKELRKLGHQARERIRPKMLALAENPRPHGVKKLSGEEDLWRIRVGDYRVIYQISDRELVVLVVRVRHRSDAYR